MSQEIIYTSAPKGLKPGSRGFCTVVSTDGMAKNLAERLESLSGYRHAFPVHDANAHLNPVNYAHVIVTVAGRKLHVLSRIADAGTDYTQRSNKLAHHVALEEPEAAAAPGGPAWVLADEKFTQSKFDGQPKIIAKGRRPREDVYPHSDFAAWWKLAGDAGWAGVLAESAMESRPRTQTIVYPPGADVLPLVVEALALLSPRDRWKVTFSTYFTKLPAGVECQWRFLLEGTAEATAARRNPHVKIIDLCGNTGQAEGGELVAMAREGRTPTFEAARAPAARRRAEPHGPAARPPARGKTAKRQQVTDAPPGWLAPLDDDAADQMDPVAPPVQRRDDDLFQPRTKSPLRMIAIAGLLVVLIAGGMVTAYLLGSRNNVTPPITQNDPNDKPDPNKDKQIPPKKFERPPEVKPDPKPMPMPMPEPEPEPEPAPMPMPEPEPKPAPMPMPEPEPEPMPLPENPLEDVHKRSMRLPLPPRGAGLSGGTQERLLAEVFVNKPEQVDLSLRGIDDLDLTSGTSIELEIVAGNNEVRQWDVIYKVPTGLKKENKIGEFRLQGQQLFFQWENATAKSLTDAMASLPNASLEITIPQMKLSASCFLREPTVVALAVLEFDKEKDPQYVIKPVTLEELSGRNGVNSERLRVDIRGEGFPAHTFVGGSVMKVGEKRTLRFKGTREEREEQGHHVEFEFTLLADGESGPPYFSVTPYAHIAHLDKKGDDVEVNWKRDRIESAAQLRGEKASYERKSKSLAGEITKIEKDMESIGKNRDLAKEKITAIGPIPETKKEDPPQLKAELQRKRMARDAFQKDVEACNRDLDVLQKDRNKALELKALMEKCVEWCTEIEGRMAAVDGTYKLGYRAFIEIGGNEVTYVETKPANK